MVATAKSAADRLNGNGRSADFDEPELIDVSAMSGGTLAALTRAEIDVQIATAKQYPRSIKRFTDQVMEMACLDEDTAGDCMYSVPRDGKHIVGPSVRFAEIVSSAWGNCKAGARVIAEEDKFVVAQGVFHDLERNVCITYEVRRRITGKTGRRFSDDMIGTTANAACSIALRNAVFKGVPKAFWKKGFDAAQRTAIGNAETLVSKRKKMVDAFALMGVTPEMIVASLGVSGIADIGLDHMAALRGMFTAIKDEGQSIESVFHVEKPTGPRDSSINDVVDQLPGVKKPQSKPESTEDVDESKGRSTDEPGDDSTATDEAAGESVGDGDEPGDESPPDDASDAHGDAGEPESADTLPFTPTGETRPAADPATVSKPDAVHPLDRKPGEGISGWTSRLSAEIKAAGSRHRLVEIGSFLETAHAAGSISKSPFGILKRDIEKRQQEMLDKW